MSTTVKFIQGNVACAEGALRAGARFFAGYPITPSSEVAEVASRELPALGGRYVQMEDELGSIAAVIGASAAGVKAFTATSGPGFSLMQENLGMAVMGEVPCVLINVQRSGPSTGLATKPAQADIMQSRWGTHGDHGIVVLYPSTVQECFELTVKAFNIAERVRNPVILLSDEVVGHMREKVVIPDSVETVDRKKPSGPAEDYLPFEPDEDGVPPMAAFGDSQLQRLNSSMHGPDGFTFSSPDNAEAVITRFFEKIENYADELTFTREFWTEGAEVLITAVGYTARAARAAARQLRAEGLRVGVFQPLTVWPFPEDELLQAAAAAETVVVPEMNMGQLVHEVERIIGREQVLGLHKSNGKPLFIEEIAAKAREAVR